MSANPNQSAGGADGGEGGGVTRLSAPLGWPASGESKPVTSFPAIGPDAEKVWKGEDGIYCVVCPDCAFTFDADHRDESGHYSCPACAEIALRKGLRFLQGHASRALVVVRAARAWDDAWEPPHTAAQAAADLKLHEALRAYDRAADRG